MARSIENTQSTIKIFRKNIFYAFFAQGISLVLSVIMALVVPKVMGIEEFSYWQLFLFYSGYSGFFHFGLNDGIYLREGGTNYNKLNTKLIGTQFRVSFLFHCILSVVVIVSSLIIIEDSSRSFVWIATAISLPLINAISFIGYIFQAVNQTKIYSLSVILDKVIFIIAILVLLLLQYDDFFWFVVLYLCSKIFSLLYCIWKGRQIVFSQTLKLKSVFKEISINISVGINLMFSNIASLLVLGNGRFIVDKVWGITTFGTISFALLLTNFFLTFIAQISMVLFPALRQTDEIQLKRFYYISRDILGVVLAGFLLAYMPLNYILDLWLPQYKESLQYLALLLPLCTYEGKMNLLCTTYFKVLRKEKLLLKINLMSLMISVIMSVIGGYVFKNIYVVVISMVVAVAIRSIISETYLAKLMEAKILKDIVIETLLVLSYIACTWYISPIAGFITYLIFYVIYLLISRQKIAVILKTIKNVSEKNL